MQWYIKHLCACHHGAIAFVHDHWLYTEQPLALQRDSRLWSKQFALSEEQYTKMQYLKWVKEWDEDEQYWKWNINRTEDLAAVGATSILREASRGMDGHEYRRGVIITLPELIMKLGCDHTSMEIMQWWTHAQKLAKEERRQAAGLRFKKTGHYGHGRRWY